MFAHLLALPPAFHQRRRAGELMSRLGQDIPRVQEFVSILGTTLLPNALTLVGIIVVMAAVDFEFALFALVMAPLLILISRRWSGLLRTNLRRVRALDGELWAAAQEMLSAVLGRPRARADGDRAGKDQGLVRRAADCRRAARRNSAKPLRGMV